MQQKIQENKSAYCNYNDTFTEYDQQRQPNGLKELLNLLREDNLSIEQQTILEGGFGTGAYTDLLRRHVKAAYGIEGSDEGLKQALKKMGDAANVHLQLGNILDLTFSTDRFDAYIVNQVLHHLDRDPDYPNLNLFLKEARRVLKPGGVLAINTSTREQLDPHLGAYWNYHYIEKAARALQARYIPIDMLVARMENLRFTDIKTIVPTGKLFQERYYNDPSIAIEPEFQKGDSVYCFLSREEIESANASIRSGLKDGSVHAVMKRAADRAVRIGEAVIVSGRKQQG